MNNIGYIFIVRRLGKQSKLILSRLDSISNLELNLGSMAYVTQMLTQEPIYKPSSIFCFKPILPSAHKLILLIYGDNRNANRRYYSKLSKDFTKYSSKQQSNSGILGTAPSDSK